MSERQTNDNSAFAALEALKQSPDYTIVQMQHDGHDVRVIDSMVLLSMSETAATTAEDIVEFLCQRDIHVTHIQVIESLERLHEIGFVDTDDA